MIRRDLLRLGGTVAIANFLPWAAQARTTDKPAIAIFDGRYSDARLFAQAARARGALAYDSRGDVASLWHEDDFARHEAATLIGLTTYSDMLIMSDLARDMDLRRSFHAMHDARGSAEVWHLPQNAEAGTPDFCAGAAWPISLADCLHRANEQAGSFQRSGPRAADHPGTLWSWKYDALSL
jgi:hypothetical protein